MATIFTRALDDLLAQITTVGGWGVNSPSDQFIDWRTLNDDRYPWCAVELASAGQQVEDKAERGRIYELAPADVWLAALCMPGGPSRQRVREELLKKVWNALFSPTGGMQARFNATLVANASNGCTGITPETGAIRDEGLPFDSRYGVCRLPVVLVMQYDLGAM